jgi:hypothetical protein
MSSQTRKDNRTSTTDVLNALGYSVLFITRADIEVYYFCVGPLGRNVVIVQEYKSSDQDLVKQNDTVKWNNQYISGVTNNTIIFPLDRETGIKYTTKRQTINGEYYIIPLDKVTKDTLKVMMEVDEFFSNKGNKDYTESVESIRRLTKIINDTKKNEENIKKYSILMESTFRDIRNSRVQCQKHLKLNEYEEAIKVSVKLVELDSILRKATNEYSEIAKNILKEDDALNVNK